MNKSVTTLKKRMSIMLLALVLCFGTLVPVIAYAGNDSFWYNFNIKPRQEWTHWTNDQYRETSNPKNQWKVGMIGSGEPTSANPDGSGITVTNFRLGRLDGTAGSSIVSVKEAELAKLYVANDKASKQYIYLWGRDNNSIASNYVVSGVWDEETGIIKN